MTRVITYGTFDMFHYGHLNILRKAKNLGNYLIVGVSTDEFNEIKGKKCIFPYSQRKEIVENIKFVDKVIPEKNWEQKIDDIKKNDIDIFVIGEDWKGKFDYLEDYCKVIYLKRTKDVSTTQLKEIFDTINEKSIKNIEKSLSLLKDIKKNFKN